jgi:TolC family type I secretion outer membrane protein
MMVASATAKEPETSAATSGTETSTVAKAQELSAAVKEVEKLATTSAPEKRGLPPILDELSCQDPFILALSNAYITNPQLHAAVRQQYAAAESVPLALAGWRPNVQVQGTVFKDKTITEGTAQQIGKDPFDPVGFNKVSLDETQNSSHAISSLTVTQNLFQGGQTVYGVSKAENDVLAGEASLLNTEQQILLNSIQFYLDVWKNKKVLEFKQASETFQKSLLDQIRAQVEVGEKTITDLAQQEATYAQAIADRITAEAQLEASKASYRQTIGLEPPENIEPPKALVGFSDLPKTLEEMKKLASDMNPPVLQALFQEKSANANVSVQEGKILPSLDASINGERRWQQDGNGKNTNKLHQRTNYGKAQLQLTIPIYQSGSEWAQLRQANQTRYQAVSALKQQKLAAIQAAVQAWESWKAGEESSYQLEIAVKAAAITVEGRRQQFIVGEGTLTDVLQAQSNFVQQQSALVQAQRDYMFYGYTLLSLYGNLLPVTLRLPVCRYDVKAYEAGVKDQVIGRGDLRPDLTCY